MRSLFCISIPVTILLISCQSKERQEFTIEDHPLPAIVKDSVQISAIQDNAIFVDAVKLSSDYIANEVKADKSYKGRTLVVSGRIQEITKGMGGDIYVVFSGANKQRVILCEFNNEESSYIQ